MLWTANGSKPAQTRVSATSRTGVIRSPAQPACKHHRHEQCYRGKDRCSIESGCVGGADDEEIVVRRTPQHHEDERALPAERADGKTHVTQRDGKQKETGDAETEHRQIGGRQPLVTRQPPHNGLHAPDEGREKHAERARSGRGNAITRNGGAQWAYSSSGLSLHNGRPMGRAQLRPR